MTTGAIPLRALTTNVLALCWSPGGHQGTTDGHPPVGQDPRCRFADCRRRKIRRGVEKDGGRESVDSLPRAYVAEATRRLVLSRYRGAGPLDHVRDLRPHYH